MTTGNKIRKVRELRGYKQEYVAREQLVHSLLADIDHLPKRTAHPLALPKRRPGVQTGTRSWLTADPGAITRVKPGERQATA